MILLAVLNGTQADGIMSKAIKEKEIEVDKDMMKRKITKKKIKKHNKNGGAVAVGFSWSESAGSFVKGEGTESHGKADPVHGHSILHWGKCLTGSPSKVS